MLPQFRSFLKQTLVLSFILTFLSCSLFDELDGDSEEKMDEVEYSYYSGYWNINTAFESREDNSQSSENSLVIESFKVSNSAKNENAFSYNLSLFRPDDWTTSIYFSNNRSSEGQVGFGDNIYLGYSVVNTGSETYSVYFGHPEARIAVYWDDELVDEFGLELLSSNTFQSATFEVVDYFGDLNLSPGNHNVVVELKLGGSVRDTRSRTVEIEAPEFSINNIELTENYYIVEANEGFYYGPVSSSSSQITMNGFGVINIDSQQDEMLTGEIELFAGKIERAGQNIFPITMNRIPPRISDSPMVNLLCHDPWELTNSTSSTARLGTLWRFTKNGFYDFVNTSGVQRKYWGYVSEDELSYGLSSSNLNGSVSVVEITADRLVLEDFQNTFEFAKYTP